MSFHEKNMTCIYLFSKVSYLVLTQGEKEVIDLIFRWYSLTIAHYKLQPYELTAVVKF